MLKNAIRVQASRGSRRDPTTVEPPTERATASKSHGEDEPAFAPLPHPDGCLALVEVHRAKEIPVEGAAYVLNTPASGRKGGILRRVFRERREYEGCEYSECG